MADEQQNLRKCKLINLESELGKRLLQEAAYTNLVRHFCKQVCRTYCGLCSIAISFNGILENLDPSSRLKREVLDFVKAQNTQNFTENSILEYKGVKDVLSLEELNTKGMTLEQLGNVVSALGIQSTVYFAENNHDLLHDKSAGSDGCERVGNVNDFRSILLDVMKKPLTHVTVNYSMADLGLPVEFGHFSPLGGYHAQKDRFLVLDVWPSTPVAWVKTEDLFNAMTSVDSWSGKTRGFCVVAVKE